MGPNVRRRCGDLTYPSDITQLLSPGPRAEGVIAVVIWSLAALAGGAPSASDACVEAGFCPSARRQGPLLH